MLASHVHVTRKHISWLECQVARQEVRLQRQVWSFYMAGRETEKLTAKDACYCRPVRAAQSPQECRLRTEYPLPWTPRKGSRQAPPTPSASTQSHHAKDVNVIYPSSGSVAQNRSLPYNSDVPQLLYQSSGVKIEGEWPMSNSALSQVNSQQAAHHQPPPLMPPRQVATPGFHGFQSTLGIAPTHQPQVGPHIPESGSNNMSIPVQMPPVQNPSSCCHSGSGLKSLAEILSQTQTGESQSSQAQEGPSYGMMRPIPADVYPELNFHGLDKCVTLSTIVKVL